MTSWAPAKSIILLTLLIVLLWDCCSFGSELKNTPKALYAGAIVHLKAGRVAQACDHLNRALRLAEAEALSGVLPASILYCRAVAFTLLDRPEAALRDLKNALALASEAGRHRLVAKIHNQTAEIWSRRGHPLHALDVLYLAQETLSRIKDRGPLEKGLQARIYTNQGIVHYQLGHFRQALTHFQQAREIFEDQEKAQSSLIVKVHIANAYQNLGMVKEAAQAYQAAVDQAELQGDEKTRADALSGLAVVYQYEGRQHEALEVIKDAMKSHRNANDYVGVAVDKNNLGQIYENLKDYEQARDYYLDALKAFQGLKRKGKEGITLANLGYLHLLEQNDQQALDYLQRAQDILDKCPCAKEQATVYEYMGRFHLSEGTFDEAAAYFETARLISEGISRMETLWRTLAGLGRVKQLTGRLQEALHYYRKSVETIEQTRRNHIEPKYHGIFLYDKHEVFNALIRLLLKLNDKYAALENLNQRNQWRLRDQIDKAVFFQNPRRKDFYEAEKALYNSLQSLHRQLKEAKKAPDRNGPELINRLLAKRAEEQDAYQWLLSQIKKEDPLLYQGLGNEKLNLSELLRTLPPDRAVIAYFLDGEDLFIFSLTAEGLELKEQKGVGRLLKEETSCFRKIVAKPPTAATADLDLFHASSFLFHEILIAPLGDHILTKKHLYVLPDEVLWTVPFSAIARKNGKEIRYIINDHTITLINSLADFGGQLSGMSFQNSGRNPKVIAFGNPEGNLPAADREVLLAERLDPEARIFSGKEATKQNLRNYARSADILILAAHAYRPPRTLETYIGLAPEADDDGRLKANDIRGLDLSGVSLVILSGCGTALSHEGEETFLSLSDAFLFAGVETVMATLWDISDAGAFEMMSRFTERIEGNTYEEALQLAQKTGFTKKTYPQAALNSRSLRGVRYSLENGRMKETMRVDLSHPYFWAPFCVIKAGVRP